MNSHSRRKVMGLGLFNVFLLLGIFGLVFAFTPRHAWADSNEATPAPTQTATPLPSFTPAPVQPITDTNTVLSLPVVENTTAEDSAPLPPFSNETTSSPSSFLQATSRVNQCLIGAIVLGLIAITMMVVFTIVKRMRT